jgi:hypothetical protein
MQASKPRKSFQLNPKLVQLNIKYFLIRAHSSLIATKKHALQCFFASPLCRSEAVSLRELKPKPMLRIGSARRSRRRAPGFHSFASLSRFTLCVSSPEARFSTPTSAGGLWRFAPKKIGSRRMRAGSPRYPPCAVLRNAPWGLALELES